MSETQRYSQATLPTPWGEFTIVVYRHGADEHVAMVFGEVATQDAVLARVHSSCLTGEVLHSLRCDCKAQLEQAMAQIAAAGSGILIYLLQEGRGIGLGNKVAAYALQDDGRDTVDANVELGFEADQRSYEIAAAILRDQGVESVRLMTNNPAKVQGLASLGISVPESVRLWVGENETNQNYLATKKKRMGHVLEK